MDYIVVFRNTPAAGVYAGVITWAVYASKEAFDDDYRKDFLTEGAHQEVLEEGVSTERAEELAKSTPLLSRVRVAVAGILDNTDVEGFSLDELDLLILQLEMLRPVIRATHVSLPFVDP